MTKINTKKSEEFYCPYWNLTNVRKKKTMNELNQNKKRMI